MKRVVKICKVCRRVNVAGWFTTLPRDEQYNFDKMDKVIEYVTCSSCS